jgi:hypothetical protein
VFDHVAGCNIAGGLRKRCTCCKSVAGYAHQCC